MKGTIVLAVLSVACNVLGDGAQVGGQPPIPTNDVSVLLSKYLPGYSVREVPPTERTGRHLELVAPNGTPVLDVPHWKGLKPLKESEPPTYWHFGNPQLNALLRDRKTRILSAADALEVGRLIWVLGRSRYECANKWPLDALRIERGWLLKVPTNRVVAANVEHIGDFEVLVDPDHTFVEFREQSTLPKESNKPSEATR
jgi:hypothetical protein